MLGRYLQVAACLRYVRNKEEPNDGLGLADGARQGDKGSEQTFDCFAQCQLWHRFKDTVQVMLMIPLCFLFDYSKEPTRPYQMVNDDEQWMGGKALRAAMFWPFSDTTTSILSCIKVFVVLRAISSDGYLSDMRSSRS